MYGKVAARRIALVGALAAQVSARLTRQVRAPLGAARSPRLRTTSTQNALTADRSSLPSRFVRVLGSVVVSVSGAVVALAVTSTPASASGGTVYAAVDGSGTLCTSGSPCELVEALSLATSGDTVDLAAGTYQPASATSFTISTSIPIQPTTPGSTVTLEGNNATVLVVNSSVTASIEGVTVEGGVTGSETEGGGIANGGTLTVSATTISGNSSIGGGGIYNGNGGTLTVDDSSISNNTAGVALAGGASESDGGGAIANDGTLTVSGSTISGNSDAFGGGGGGIRNTGTMTVSGSTISANTSIGSGGISNENGGTLIVEDSVISGNRGGGVHNGRRSLATVEDSVISDNTVSGFGQGGGIYNEASPFPTSPGGTLTVEASTISANTAVNEAGGGIYNGFTATVEDSTISGNIAGFGGGIYNTANSLGGTLTVEASTVSDNTVSSLGGGIYILGSDSTVTLAADVIARQSAGEDCYNNGIPMITDASYNIDDDGTCNLTLSNNSVSGSTVIDSYLGSLGSHGGPTQTVPLLAVPSPTTSSADPALAVTPPTFDLPVAVHGVSLACSVPDQRGVIRGQPCDIGAFELGDRNVTFDANGGSGMMAAEAGNGPMALTANGFTRTGFTFAAWNTAANGNGTGYADGATYPFSVNVTLYAQWTAITYTVTFDPNGGSGTMTPEAVNAPTALTSNDFTWAGHAFGGWNTSANGSGSGYADGATYPFTADATLYAQWTVNPIAAALRSRVVYAEPNARGAVKTTIVVKIKGAAGYGMPTGSVSADSGFRCTALKPPAHGLTATAKCVRRLPSGEADNVTLTYSGDAAYGPTSTPVHVTNGGADELPTTRTM
jgi:hypothetical protein